MRRARANRDVSQPSLAHRRNAVGMLLRDKSGRRSRVAAGSGRQRASEDGCGRGAMLVSRTRDKVNSWPVGRLAVQ
ncbi:hypothetical protein T210_0111340 [Burkholderia pseudomallei MSHR6137]|nr:hypothetical protein T210_0111340 [Burkholderia pseudomallei MSHR6137]